MTRRLALAAALVVLGGSAGGQPPPRPPLDRVFKRLDANGDGKLSREEFGKLAEIAPRLRDNADAVFKRLDADGDGYLTLDEFKKLAGLMPRAAGKAKPPAEPDKPISDDQLAFFEKKIRPVLVSKCYGCHSA